ncbi:MAG: alpha/beta hydrolase [Burkholderiaceae bacterium]|nr:alpha/beta hydrolase [Microbacteriaceae bacterium]
MTSAARTLALALVVLTVLTGCGSTGSDSTTVDSTATAPYPATRAYPGVAVLTDLDYGAQNAGTLLDVCLPADVAEPASAAGTTEPATTTEPTRAAVLSVHGGSWRQGDKDDVAWRSVCEWLASEGFVAVSVNYALAPEHPFPAGIDDVRTAVKWLRENAQVERFNIDPARIGALGGSAGGNLVSLLGAGGSGPLDSGSRVAAVVDLSGPADLTTAGFSLGGVISTFRTIQLAYLGCASYSDCPQARAASPLYSVDRSDPPFFVGHSLDEIIPQEQSEALVEKLRGAGVSVEFVTVEGTRHSIAMLDPEMRERISTWLRDRLAG